MIPGFLMLIAPVVIFLVTLPAAKRLRPPLRWLYRLAGGGVVLGGSAFSFYLSAYTGDQGGIGAYFFQIAVIGVYLLFSVFIATFHLFAIRNDKHRNES
jgi:hypothetical protein